MFGFIGKVMSAIKFIAPILPFIPGLQALAPLLKIAEVVTNIVDKFSKGLEFLETVSKIAPMPKAFSQITKGFSDLLGSSKVDFWRQATPEGSKSNKAFNLMDTIQQGVHQVNAGRNSALSLIFG